MIELEVFKKIIKDIQKNDKNNDELAKLLKADYIMLGDALTYNLINLIQKSMKNGNDLLDWWLYEISDKNKFCYEQINDKETIVYNLNDIEDLYHYMNGDLHKVKQSLVDNDVLNIRKTQNLQNTTVKNIFENLGIFEDE